MRLEMTRMPLNIEDGGKSYMLYFNGEIKVTVEMIHQMDQLERLIYARANETSNTPRADHLLSLAILFKRAEHSLLKDLSHDHP